MNQLTDEEITRLWNEKPVSRDFVGDFARAVIAAHDERLRHQGPVAWGHYKTWSDGRPARFRECQPDEEGAFPLYAAPIPPEFGKPEWFNSQDWKNLKHEACQSPAAPIPTPSQQKALNALDDMDDYARMAGVDAVGTRMFLKEFILARPDALTGWQPIETAPSMGKPVLVFDGKKILRAALAKKFELSEDDNGVFNDGEGSDYNEANDTTYWPEGWYEWNEYEEIHWRLEREPIHWMPLPARPEVTK